MKNKLATLVGALALSAAASAQTWIDLAIGFGG